MNQYRQWALGVFGIALCGVSTLGYCLPKLDDDQGYILVAMKIEQGYVPSHITLDTDGWLSDLRFEDVTSNYNYWLEVVDAGSYTWDRVYLGKRTYIDVAEQGYVINVEAGKINYAGHLSMYTEMNGSLNFLIGGARFYFNNKASQALEYMEASYPEVLSQYNLNYTGKEKDHFFEYAKAIEGNQL
ncbi:hypothetical protein [Shewanella saliphila]|uniref:Uncharacterized protein n=1 Tax=Shewanella saliphila TaxID=2282698 RepID=A0ABQ2Q932_9GAMM|nr:hypothetical protein [Shewanella saliphila]MCL1102423.1 hypothetical protein [Shewanella saliphila]GGP56404.1 hypothetical protein GCM10009409_23250 [Shewanella saliphila]